MEKNSDLGSGISISDPKLWVKKRKEKKKKKHCW
jgi:hypothetical protein